MKSQPALSNITFLDDASFENHVFYFLRSVVKVKFTTDYRTCVLVSA